MEHTVGVRVKTKADISTDRLWNPLFISIFIANACMYLSQWMVNSITAKYADFLGAPANIVGMVSSMFAFTALLFKVVSGPAIDTFNRRLILMSAMFVMGIAFFGYGISESVSGLIVFRLVQGCGQAFTATCCLALAADALPQNKFGAGIGIFSLAQAVMQAIGPTAGLVCLDLFGYRITFFAAGVIMAAAIFFASRVKVASPQGRKFRLSLNSIFAREAVLPGTVMFFLSLAFSVINSFLVIYAGQQGVETGIGLYFTIYACTLLFTRPMVGRLSDRFGMVKVVIPAMCCFAVSFLLISISDSLVMFLFAGFVAGFGYGACQPAIQSLAMKCVGTARRGAASSTNYIGSDLGQLLGPNVAGAVVVASGYTAMWRVMTVFIFIAIVLIWVNKSRICMIEEKFV